MARVPGALEDGDPIARRNGEAERVAYGLLEGRAARQRVSQLPRLGHPRLPSGIVRSVRQEVEHGVNRSGYLNAVVRSTHLVPFSLVIHRSSSMTPDLVAC
jgi:hypothetical protein